MLEIIMWVMNAPAWQVICAGIVLIVVIKELVDG